MHVSLRVACARDDGTGGHRLQGRSHYGLPGVVLGQRQRPVRRLHENPADKSQQKYDGVRGVAGKTFTC